jgi:hypothetical protein
MTNEHPVKTCHDDAMTDPPGVGAVGGRFGAAAGVNDLPRFLELPTALRRPHLRGGGQDLGLVVEGHQGDEVFVPAQFV